MSETKIINDPVFGFIKIPGGLLMDIVNHPTIQRLSRIKQLGLASMVYPGAQHTRFQHSLGAFHLMSEAILSLSQKGVFIFDSEAEAIQAAILLHDIAVLAYEDQCSPANPRLPIVTDMEEIMADAYYGYAERPGRRK